MADSVQYDDREVRELLEKAGVVFLEGTAVYADILEVAGRKVGATHNHQKSDLIT